MNNLQYKIDKYLQKHAAETGRLYFPAKRVFEDVVVVPAIGELENVKKLLFSLDEKNDSESKRRTLVLFVVNNLKSTPVEIKENNFQTIDFLKTEIAKSANAASELNIAVIDCSSEGNELPEKEGGVGLARKIGMDAALTFFNYDSDRKNIITSLDSDCVVGNNYFASIINSFNRNNYSAAYVRFEHTFPNDEENLKAIVVYEIFLRYYLLGLKFAGSPYAIHTIGSTMICDAESYVKIGGMNKRKAAEDFYFMEKLSKVVEVKEISETVIYPSPRGSWRVPFGTGQRVNRFLSHVTDEYLLYNPKSFVILKEWLRIFSSAGFKTSAESLLENAFDFSPPLTEFLEINNFAQSWNSIKANSKKNEQLNKQKKFWFDGFKTLKLIHYLRDNGFPPVFTFKALNELFGLTGFDFESKYEGRTFPPISVQKKYLMYLREIA
ncbi:MAG: hypothetical protein GXO87_06820 [Chlorobi bacterium]|nr:hypothetical protein [Chlorobiota bacterium]